MFDTACFFLAMLHVPIAYDIMNDESLSVAAFCSSLFMLVVLVTLESTYVGQSEGPVLLFTTTAQF